jgi:polysaccharide deacetylase family protein (PEP-CTERM system associated)
VVKPSSRRTIVRRGQETLAALPLGLSTFDLKPFNGNELHVRNQLEDADSPAATLHHPLTGISPEMIEPRPSDHQLPSIVNAMTVDVEDYFHVSAFEASVLRERWDSFESRVVRNTDRLLDLFHRAGIRATFFVLGWVAERHPALVGRIAAAGHELGSHGYGHRLVYDQSPGEFREDLRKSRDIIGSAASTPIDGYRAPSFSITSRSLWALDIIREEGFVYDASVFPILHDRYGMPSASRHFYNLTDSTGTLWECPGSTVRVAGTNFPVAGGGYFRLLPYGWTRWGIARLNRVERRPAIFYVHPWEIDPQQPQLPGSPLSVFRHYTNLDKTEGRLIRLMAEFRFGPLGEVLRESMALPASIATASR